MKNLFVEEYLNIGVSRKLSAENQIVLTISSDFSGSNRKSQLYVNEKRLGEKLEYFWKSIKTKKLLALRIMFDEIDYYDNHTDMYSTPIVYIKRGLKKARFDEHEHGCIPKEWSVDFIATFSDTTTSTPILEVVKSALGSYLTPQREKKFLKILRPFLQKKEKNVYYELDFPYKD